MRDLHMSILRRATHADFIPHTLAAYSAAQRLRDQGLLGMSGPRATAEYGPFRTTATGRDAYDAEMAQRRAAADEMDAAFDRSIEEIRRRPD